MTPEDLQEVDARIDNRLNQIAELAAVKAIEHVYADIGKGLISKLLWAAGIIGLSILAWMAGKGMKIPSP